MNAVAPCTASACASTPASSASSSSESRQPYMRSIVSTRGCGVRPDDARHDDPGVGPEVEREPVGDARLPRAGRVRAPRTPRTRRAWRVMSTSRSSRRTSQLRGEAPGLDDVGAQRLRRSGTDDLHDDLGARRAAPRPTPGGTPCARTARMHLRDDAVASGVSSIDA